MFAHEEITNRKEYFQRGWISNSYTINENPEDCEGGLSIDITGGQTHVAPYPVVMGYQVWLLFKSNAILRLTIYDIGREDTYFEELKKLRKKYESLVGKQHKSTYLVLEKMKDLACKFAFQYGEPAKLVRSISAHAFNSGEKEGGNQVRWAIKNALDLT